MSKCGQSHFVVGMDVIPDGFINRFLGLVGLVVVREYRYVEDASHKHGRLKLMKSTDFRAR